MYCCKRSIPFIVKFCAYVTVMCQNDKFLSYWKKGPIFAEFLSYLLNELNIHE